MQALVDFRGLFMDVYIGWPGKVHDARVFTNSSLYQRGINGTLFPDWSREMNGTLFPDWSREMNGTNVGNVMITINLCNYNNHSYT